MGNRQLAITKRFSLAQIGAGWNKCYIDYRPATIADLKEFETLDPEGMGNAAVIDFMFQKVKEHLVAGQVLVIMDTGVQYVPLEHSDIDNLPPAVVSELFAEMSGGNLDPKDMPKDQPTGNDPSSADDNTETQ